jgi:hypothetical protein
MRNLLPLLGALILSPALAQTVATYNFEQGLDGFTPAAAPQVTQETAHPLVGAGALRLTLDEKARELKVTSPEFPVQPWTLYRVRIRQNTDLGALLRVGVELNAAEGWRPGSYYALPDGGGPGLFGTFPDSARGRLTLTLSVPDQALGRSSVVDEIRISQEAPLVKEAGINLYWDGGFELDKNDMSYWVQEPKKMEVATDRPHSGLRCLHVESDRTYVVFPYVPVQPLRLYRFRCWVRGTGTIYPGLHKLAPSDWLSMRADTAVRVGWASPLVQEIRLQADTWQQVELVTPCESDRIIWFNMVLTFAGGTMDVDDAELVSLAQ